ncbi:MAG: tRNA (adenine-N1)-methyltransferase [Myxococcales bacterium]|nr:tRNA (adenine-N1)-methyltransferase [Myxococcales bacterium]MCB9525234.1 tRNA (adenine-N1)-methyltransferase [Myxococcales bacterium]
MTDPEITPESFPLLRDGQPVVIIDERRQSHYVVLKAGGGTNFKGNQIAHDDLIGRPDGCTVHSHKGKRFEVLSATYEDHALGMPRHAAIVYPKDTAAIALHADLKPGLTVVEAGLGSGALSIALLRAIGPTGKLYTYEKIPDAIVRAKKNIALAMGDTSNHTIHEEADIYEGIRERSVDRVVLDVPEPWQVLPHAKEVVRPGGGIAIFVPTALQMHETVQELYRVGGFIEFKAMEILERRWKVSARSVRPENQMIAHTGFLMFARRTAPRDA